MIARIKGKVLEKRSSQIILDVSGICYEILLPQAVMQRIDENVLEDGMVNIITYHYHQVEPSRSTPVLIGFFNEIEKEFFQAFISVSGIGPRAAVKAINQPISLIAKAIDEGDADFLRTLPGIGQQKARDIIAKLQNKVGKFGLIQDASNKGSAKVSADIMEEALAVLMQLQYKRAEASLMLKNALEKSPSIISTEELLNEVYKQKRQK